MKIANKTIPSPIGIAAILIAAALIIGGIIFYFNSRTPASGTPVAGSSGNEAQTSSQATSGTPAASSPQNTVATWKTYKGNGKVDTATDYSYEINYPPTWDYTTIGTTGPIFGPKSVITAINQSKNPMTNDKSVTVLVTITNKALYNESILPYRNSNNLVQFSSSQMMVDGFPGIYYLVRHLTTQNGYLAGDRSAIVDVKTNNYYLTLSLADYQYSSTFQRMMSSLKILK